MGTANTTTRAQSVRANAQTAQVCALGSNGQCSFCKRTGLPILPLRYAVIPNVLKGRSEDVLSGDVTLGAGVTDKALAGHHYTVRTLRAGFVHVYLGTRGRWQVYATTADGLLRLLADPDDPDQKGPREITPSCVSSGHNIPAAFINIPPTFQRATVWIAFSRDAWSQPTRTKYERAPGKRMQSFDCSQLASNPDPVQHAFEITPDPRKLNALVDEYTTDAAQAIARRLYSWTESVDSNKDGVIRTGQGPWGSAHGFFPRSGQLTAVGKFAADYSATTKKRGPEKKVSAVVLFDPVGIVEEINYIRLLVVEWRAKYSSHISIARPRLVSQAIQGTRKIYESVALRETFAEKRMVIVDEINDANKAANPGKELVLAETAEAKAKTSEIIYYPPPLNPVGMGGYMPSQPIRSNVWDESQARARSDWRRMEGHYDEKARSDFDKSYERETASFQEQLERYGGDYSMWVDANEWKSWLADYAATVGEEVANSIKLAASCLSGGPTDTKTYELWKRWLEARPNDPSNPVYAAMFGQAKGIVDVLMPDGLPFDAAPDKSDKLFDTVKGLRGSKQGEELIKLVVADAGLVAAISHIELAVSNAVATLGKNLSVRAQAVALRAQQAALHFYKGTHAAFIKLTMTVGQYLDVLKATGMDAARRARAAHQALSRVLEDVTTQGGKKVRALMVAGLMKISDPRVRNIVIEVSLWTTEGAAALRAIIAGVKREAISAVRGVSVEALALIGRMRVAGVTVSREAAAVVNELAAGLRLSASQTASLAKKLMAGAMRASAAKGEVLLAAGSIGFQTWALLDSLREMEKKVGAERREAWLSVISASVGIAAGVAEAAGLVMRAVAVTGWKLALRVGGVLAAIASIVDSVQAFCAFWRTRKQGDSDASWLYFGAAWAFLGAAVAGVAVVGAATTAGFAALTLAGPLGWAILLVVVGVGLLFAAMWAEDTTLEIWLDRCRFGNGERSEGRWSDAQHGDEMAALNSVILGAKAEAGFNDNWNELFSGVDTVNIRVTLPQFNSDGSAYAIQAFAVTAGGSWIPIYSRNHNSTTNIAAVPAVIENRYEQLPGSEKASMEGGARLISVDVNVNRAIYRKVRVRMQYWPDMSDETALLEIDRLVTD